MAFFFLYDSVDKWLSQESAKFTMGVQIPPESLKFLTMDRGKKRFKVLGSPAISADAKFWRGLERNKRKVNPIRSIMARAKFLEEQERYWK